MLAGVSILLLLCCANRAGAAENSTENVLHQLLDPAVYGSTTRPLLEENLPVAIQIDVAINAIGPVRESDMDMTTSFFLRQSWVDPRLAYSHTNASLTLSHRLQQRLWLPDLYFPNGKEEHLHDVTTPNVLLRLHPDGRILYSQRLTVTTQCVMDLSHFPLDHQVCSIIMESYGHTTRDLYFSWQEGYSTADVLPNAFIPDFSLTGIRSKDCTAVYSTGNYTCLAIDLFLRREVGFYLTQTYVPSILIVFLSWASFWIEHTAVPARISVGLLTVLTITTQSSGARATLPRVPYIKAIDVWMSVCLVFVFGAYMEYAVVTVLARRHNKHRKYAEKENVVEKNGVAQAGSEAGHAGKEGRRHSYSLSDSGGASVFGDAPRPSSDPGKTTDKVSRFLFPALFFAFNTVYWIYYVLVH